MKTCKIAGINFDHFHMGDLLRMVHEHPNAELVAISDEKPERLQEAAENFSLSSEQVFTDYRECLERTQPDLVILCPAAARHSEWVEKVAPYGVHVLVEKPFASSLAEADRMIEVMRASGKKLAINWPLCWAPVQAKAHELIKEGLIGEVLEVHTYGGNSGPLRHGADKNTREPSAQEKAASWFYQKAEGGGSLMDYMGYGTTLGTWHLGGKKPIEVSCMVDLPAGLEVDEHSVTTARYASGLSTFETRWGTFTDPWILQPQPKCGFVIIGDQGTLSCYEYEKIVRVQTNDRPEGFEVEVPDLQPPFVNPIQYFIHCLQNDCEIEGPLSTDISRIGQQIVDTAIKSAAEKRTLPLLP
ncbi:MAG: Gfo/Idh/MocA family oxidoreductase [Verrucomicrobiales bacterium]|nr:Gfo/Idh/MocA family oxidoreductase [Verrucomicrobiales bacterium]